jgi:uncharacterized protein YbjQ (UPF0145 family)
MSAEERPVGSNEPATGDSGPRTGVEEPSSEERQAKSLARIEQGGITVAAERRLSELRERGGSFTSDLSVDGFALCHNLGLRPLSQVMGSSIYQMGYQATWGGLGSWGPLGLGGTFMVELDTLSQALNEVRSRALGRLAEEARHVGADAVVGVSTRAGESALETGAVALEHVVVGTAVSREGSGGSQPVLSELSVADFAKLVQAGFEPMGIVAWSAVYFAGYAFGAGIGLGEMLGPVQNFELTDFTQALYAAREAVMTRLGEQAGSLGASGIVGVRVGHKAVPHTMSAAMGSGERKGLMVTFNAIGTAIGQRENAPLYAPETTIDLTNWRSTK